MDKIDTLTRDDFRAWGKQGGKKKGSTKSRGDSEYYRNLAKKRKKKDIIVIS